MSTLQIIGVILLIIIVLIFIFGHISLLKIWKHIEVGDTGVYTNEIEGWHVLDIQVIEKCNDYMIIKYADNSKETVYKYEFLHQHKTFAWDKYDEVE